MAKHFIQSAIKHPGAERNAAKRAGMSTHAYMEEHKHDSGTAGKRARLGLTLEGMHHKGGSMKKSMGMSMSMDRKNRLKGMLSSRMPKDRDNSGMMNAANKARMKKMKY